MNATEHTNTTLASASFWPAFSFWLKLSFISFGVILNLALFFSYQVLQPVGFAGTFDWVSALIAACAVIGLLLKYFLL